MIMKIIIVFKILMLLFVFISSSITDIKYGKIYNKNIFIIILFALILNCIEWIAFDKSYSLLQIENIMICIFISLVLYFSHVWAGGDAKLMIAVSMLVPYTLYPQVSYSNFCLVYVLAFSFVFSYLFLFVDTVICIFKNRIKFSKLKAKINSSILNWVSCVIYILFFDQIITKLLCKIINDYTWILFIINICIILIVSGTKVLKSKIIILALFVSSIVLKLLFNQPILNKQMIINYTVALLFIVLRALIDEYNYEMVKVSELKPGMILSTAAVITFLNSKVKGLPKRTTEDLRSRLTEDEIKSIILWSKSKHGVDSVQIVKKIPFAVFISLGTVSFIVLGVILK